MTKPNKSDNKPEKALPSMAKMWKIPQSYEALPTANYNKLSERIRQTAPGDIQCSMFCGGRKCKYESSSHWTQEDMAVRGIFSHWVTEDILAMARPNMEMIHKFNLIDSFTESGIKSIVNLEEQGEHASCGNPLTSSGFAYEPSIFMDKNVMKYLITIKVFVHLKNRKDYSTVASETLLDMVKVIAFALSEGKVAIHCHAGLGRTGVLIACYLIFQLRCRPQDAIRFVRSRRPHAIQTRTQIESVFQFALFTFPLFIIFPHIVPKQQVLSLQQQLHRQRFILHGYELRHLRNIPKLVFMICERLLRLCNRHRSYSPGIVKNTSFEVNDSVISFQLTSSESFCNYFLSSASSSATQVQVDTNRPQSNMTIQLSSGFASPETAYTDISSSSGGESRVGTAESKTSKVIELNQPAQSASIIMNSPPSTSTNTFSSSSSTYHPFIHHQQYINSLPPVEESSDTSSSLLNSDVDTFNGPMKQIGMIGLDTPERSNSPTENGDIENSSHSSIERDPPPGSPADSLTSLIEKTLGFRVMHIADSSVIYSQDLDLLEPETDLQRFDEALARNDLLNNSYQLDDSSFGGQLSSGFASGCGTNVDDDSVQNPVDPSQVVKALLNEYRLDPVLMNNLLLMQTELNNLHFSWEKIFNETNLEFLAGLLWSWLENLQEPILNKQALTYIVLKAEKPIDALIKLEVGARYTTEYMVRFLSRLNPEPEDVLDTVIKRMVSGLTHQCFKINGTLVPGGVSWTEMRKGTTGRVMLFIKGLYALLQRA